MLEETLCRERRKFVAEVPSHADILPDLKSGLAWKDGAKRMATCFTVRKDGPDGF